MNAIELNNINLETCAAHYYDNSADAVQIYLDDEKETIYIHKQHIGEITQQFNLTLEQLLMYYYSASDICTVHSDSYIVLKHRLHH